MTSQRGPIPGWFKLLINTKQIQGTSPPKPNPNAKFWAYIENYQLFILKELKNKSTLNTIVGRHYIRCNEIIHECNCHSSQQLIHIHRNAALSLWVTKRSNYNTILNPLNEIMLILIQKITDPSPSHSTISILINSPPPQSNSLTITQKKFLVFIDKTQSLIINDPLFNDLKSPKDAPPCTVLSNIINKKYSAIMALRYILNSSPNNSSIEISSNIDTPLITTCSYINRRIKYSLSQQITDISTIAKAKNIIWQWYKIDELYTPHNNFHTPNTPYLISDYKITSYSPLINGTLICNVLHWIKIVNKHFSLLSSWDSIS
jgi:hypothetical protein